MSDDNVTSIHAKRDERVDEIAKLICVAFSRAEQRVIDEARARFGPSGEPHLAEAVNRARRAVAFLCPPVHLRVEAAAWEAKAVELRRLADEIDHAVAAAQGSAK